MRLQSFVSGISLAFCFSGLAYAQQNEIETLEQLPEDVVIAYGQSTSESHDGMKAFFDGDFETAEIEFEREFLSLKRGRSTIENAAFDAQVSQFRSEQIGNATGATGGSGGPGGAGGVQAQGNNVIAPSNSPSSSSFAKQEKGRKGILTDGVINDQDFAFSKYMSGLSEVKLGKTSEAKASFKSSLFYDNSNFDARMRLGLIYLTEQNFEKAAEQLTKLDKLRKKCQKRNCEDLSLINDSTLTLAKQITKKAHHK